ncbi:hypothetical protein ACP1PD_005308 [Escherichia coli]
MVVAFPLLKKKTADG